MVVKLVTLIAQLMVYLIHFFLVSIFIDEDAKPIERKEEYIPESEESAEDEYLEEDQEVKERK